MALGRACTIAIAPSMRVYRWNDTGNQKMHRNQTLA
jgi:hypothetical protein